MGPPSKMTLSFTERKETNNGKNLKNPVGLTMGQTTTQINQTNKLHKPHRKKQQQLNWRSTTSGITRCHSGKGGRENHRACHKGQTMCHAGQVKAAWTPNTPPATSGGRS